MTVTFCKTQTKTTTYTTFALKCGGYTCPEITFCVWDLWGTFPFLDALDAMAGWHSGSETAEISPGFFFAKIAALGGGSSHPRPVGIVWLTWLNQMEIFAWTKQKPLCAKSRKARVIGRLNGFAKSPFSEKCGFPGGVYTQKPLHHCFFLHFIISTAHLIIFFSPAGFSLDHYFSLLFDIIAQNL